MTNENTRRATADDIRGGATKEVKLMSGLTVLIRKIPYSTICEITENLPDVAVLGDEKKVEEAIGKIDTRRRMMMIEKTIVAGVFEPSFTIDGAGNSPRPSDLDRADMIDLFNVILALSGVTKEAGKEVLPLSGTPAS